MYRRHFLATSALALAACRAQPDAGAHIGGGFTETGQARGHLLRGQTQWPAPSATRRTGVLIAGGGVAGLAAARALRLRGVDDFALLELQDEAGGNSRAIVLNGIACPLGAHYLPLPGDAAPAVQDLLEDLGLRQRRAGRWEYDERHLCHSPQERLFFNGAWQEGLLPLQGVGPQTLAQYQQFATLVAQVQRSARWTIPVLNQPFTQVQHALTAITLEAWLEQNGLSDAHLRWYLDYCCRDDYGAGAAWVSAWAGLHYFASRHGFHVPGSDSGAPEGLLTWPEGNAWLTRRLALPLGERLHTGRVVLRLAHTKHGVELDAWNTATQTVERWAARCAIVALPLFVAARVLHGAPDWLHQAAASTVYAPWLVANLHLGEALHDRPGAAPSWDNVLYDPRPGSGGGSLGYVDAMHQSLRRVPAATVLTHYRTPGLGTRALLQDTPWARWRDTILAELSLAHPDLAAKTRRIDITRHAHAMAVPVPRHADQFSLQRLLHAHRQLSKSERTTGQGAAHYPFTYGRIHLAHSDLAGYSIFEEAFTLGHRAGLASA